MKLNIRPERVENLLVGYNSKNVIKNGFKNIYFDKKAYIEMSWMIFITIIPSILVAISQNTVESFEKSINIFNGIIIALFGICFTGYSIYQALMNDNLLVNLLSYDASKSDNNDGVKSKLQECNEYFVEVMMVYIVIIIINILLQIFIGSLELNFALTNNNMLNNALAGIGIYLYFIIQLRALWEIKSFIFNVFQIFNMSSGAKAIEIITRDNDMNV